MNGRIMHANEEERRRYNEWADANDAPRLQPGALPGIVFFEYGKNRLGFWEGATFVVQVEQLLKVLEFLYPNMQVVLEVDHSSGHLKEKVDGLLVNDMGMRWGGKKASKRDTKITEGCRGTNVPAVHGIKLAPNMPQSMVFLEGDDLPHFDQSALPDDRPMTAEE